MSCVAKVLAAIALLAISTAPLLAAPPPAGRDASQAEAQHQPPPLTSTRPCPPRGAKPDGQTLRAKPAKGDGGSKDGHGYGDAYRAARDLQAEIARFNTELGCDDAPVDHGTREMWDTID